MKHPSSPTSGGNSMSRQSVNRRLFGATVAGMAPHWLARPAQAEQSRRPAQACILLWMGGGMCHVDTFDPKSLGDPAAGRPGSAYRSIPTAVRDVEVCEHLSRTADLLDRGVIIRSLSHPLKIDHADSTYLMKTGRLAGGTIIHPSIGSVVSHQLGPRIPGTPPYVVIGYPNVTRGPGFLGSRFGYLYLTDTASGPVGLRRPAEVTEKRQSRRLELLDFLRQRQADRAPSEPWVQYDGAVAAALELSAGQFPRAFELGGEPAAVRQRYGSEFGQRCLLARRLVESGVRFVEVAYNLNFVNGTGWDTHRHGQKEQHRLIRDLDQSLSALVEDLERRRILDETLVVVATEFGRPPDFDGEGGRGHQSDAFSTVLFGGGLQTGQVVGATDESGRRVVGPKTTVPDFHATVLATLGIDPTTHLQDGQRPVPITDHGKPLNRLLQ